MNHLFTLLFLSLGAVTSFASESAVPETDALLRARDRGLPAFAQSIPPKTAASPGAVVFTDENVRTRDFVEIKARERRRWFEMKDAWQADDDAHALVDNADALVDRLDEIERRGLRSARLETQPWSDTYWPIYEGELGARYGDLDFPHSGDWKDNHEHVLKFPAPALIEAGKADALSPAEKYGLLVGDESDALTRSQWDDGRAYYETYGKVEAWMGLCHGWSPASFMVARPRQAVTVPAARGGAEITFYPADIRGLATLLWAKSAPRTRFIGGRCDRRRPEIEPSTGRILSDECRDVNPATWHLSIVNQLGVSRRSFVMDATYDHEVWNQPVLAYEYAYFNPATRKATKTLREASVAAGPGWNDPYRSHRASGTRSLVGVSMRVTYMVENRPEQAREAGPEDDLTASATYLYDLELDGSGRVIGGEWYQNAHPDFLWVPEPGSRAATRTDLSIAGDRWDARSVVPASWRRLAPAMGEQGRPLALLVEALVKAAAKE